MSRRVLLVDDEEALLYGLKKQIQSPTVEVDTAATLDEAMSFLERDRYDVIISDLCLGVPGGEEGLLILLYVKRRHAEAKTVLITAYGTAEVERRAYEAGASFYLEKPIGAAALRNALNQ